MIYFTLKDTLFFIEREMDVPAKIYKIVNGVAVLVMEIAKPGETYTIVQLDHIWKCGDAIYLTCNWYNEGTEVSGYGLVKFTV